MAEACTYTSAKRDASHGSSASPSMDADADIGLGGFPAVSLAKAREKAVDNRAAVAEGPRSARREARARDADFQGSRLRRP